ncbi:MAG: ribosome biogenesis GTP-binding protein YihA/YsxC [Holophagaceae bacterium]
MTPARLTFSFVKSASAEDQIGFCDCEIAIVGRSNVGKSSLINAIAQQNNLAQTSKTPGRTRNLNVYQAPRERLLIDCPGYGFARGPEEDKVRWNLLIESYLRSRKTLIMVYLCVDSYVGPTELDIDMQAWLFQNHLPYTIVATKFDQLRPSERSAKQKKLCEILSVDSEAVFWVSARESKGIDHLVLHMQKHLGL